MNRRTLIIGLCILLVLVSGCFRPKSDCVPGITCNIDAARDFNPQKDIWCRDNFPDMKYPVKEAYYHNNGWCCIVTYEPNWGKGFHLCIDKDSLNAS